MRPALHPVLLRLSALLPAALLIFLASAFALPKEPDYALVFYIAVLPSLAARLATGWRPRIDAALGLALALMTWSAMTLLWGTDDGGRTWHFTRDFVCTLAFLLAMAACLQDSATRRRARQILMIGGTADAVLAVILGFTLHADVARMHGWGVTRHPILGACAMGTAYLTALHAGLAEARGWRRLRYFAAAALMASFIALTESRGPMLAAGIATLFLCAAGPWRLPALGTLAGLAAAWKLSLPKAMQQHEAAVVVARGTSHRLEIWRHTLGEIAQAPVFGHGLAANLHLTVTGEETLNITFPHNMYLGLLFYSGAIGFLLFCALAAVLSLRLVRARKDVALPWLGALWLNALVSGMTDVGQITKGPAPVWFILWLPVGFLLTWRAGSPPAEENPN